jgi:hypothetical protein
VRVVGQSLELTTQKRRSTLIILFSSAGFSVKNNRRGKQERLSCMPYRNDAKGGRSFNSPLFLY